LFFPSVICNEMFYMYRSLIARWPRFSMRTSRVCGLSHFLLLLGWSLAAHAQGITEGFEDVPTLLSTGGWVAVNNSDEPTTIFDWVQGVSGGGVNGLGLNAQSGSANSFAQVSFEASNGNIVSDWLLTPEVTLQSGATIDFWTTAQPGTSFANDLQVAISLNGTSTNVGSNAQTPVGGDFHLVTNGDINPTLAVNGYPQAWTEFTFALTSEEVPAATMGRIGLRYYIPDTDTQGSTIGVDTFSFSFSPAAPTFTTSISGNWNDPTLWTPNGVPNGTDNIANLVLPVSGTQTVNLTAATFTVNQLNVTGAGLGGWIVSNGTLIFDGTAPIFTDQSTATGISATIAANVQLNANTAFNIVNLSAVTEVSGAISGIGQLIKTGSGTLTLTGTNNYSGGTLIGAGTLQIGNGGIIGSITGAVTDNGILAFDRSDSVTFGGAIGGTGGLVQLGSGTTILTGTNTYSGGTTITAGTLQLGNGTTTGTISGNVIDNGNFVFDSNPDQTFSGNVTGTGTLSQIGDGTITLTGINTYSGVTTVSGGTLQANSTTALSSNSAFTVNSNLNLHGNSNAVGSLAGSGTVTNNFADADAILTAGGDNTSTTFSGSLSNGNGLSTLGLTKVGLGTLTLTGTNIYTGLTTISGGTLQIGNGGTSGSIVGNVLDNSNLAFNHSDVITFSANILGTGTLSQIGTGTLILIGNNTYTGGTTINGGTLQIGNGATSGSISGNVVDNAFLTFNQSNSFELDGNVTGGGALSQIGTGHLFLGGDNTYSGTTTISNGGTLEAATTTGFSPNSAYTVNANSTLDVNGFSNTVGSLAGSGEITNYALLNPATLTAGGDNSTTVFTGTMTNGGSSLAFTKAGTGTLTLTGTNIYTGLTTITGGTLQIGNGGTSGSIVGNVLDNSNLAFNHSDVITFSANISGTGTLSQLGLGTLILTSANSYSGGTIIRRGVLSVDTDAELGNTSGGIILKLGGELLTTANFTSARSVSLNPASLGSGIVTPLAPVLVPPSILAAAVNTTAIYTGMVFGTRGLMIGDGVNDGTVVLASGANTYFGGTTVLAGATLSVNMDAELGDASGGISLKLGGELLTTANFTSARSVSLNPVSLGAGIVTPLGPGPVSPNILTAAADTTATYTGLVFGTGGLTIGDGINHGTVVLASGANTYFGGTTVLTGATLSVDTDAELGNGSGGIILKLGGELLTTANFTSARSVSLNPVSLGAGIVTPLGPVAVSPNILTAAADTTATYTGLVFGTGGLTVGDGTHTGTVTLTGDNTYSGGTEINPGTLVAAGNDALGTGPVGLFRGTLLILAGVTVQNPVNFVEGGVVNNAGTLNNSITDDFSVAETVINSGTINGSVTLGGATDIVHLFTGSKITGNLVLGANPNSTLILDGAGQQLLSLAVVGTVTNNGTLVKEGSGTWTIDRALDAPVGTEIQAGTLAVDAVLTTPLVNITPGATLQLNAGGSVGNLVNDGSLIFASTGTVTFGTVISGPGNVIQDGPGTTILSGRNTYTGGTVIELGTLLVDNAQALGTGNVTVNGGVLGADPQPINVLGNYTQNAGGTLQLNIAGRAAGQYDTLNVGGNASLSGTLRLISLGYVPEAGDALTLVTTKGSVSGQFTHFVDPFTTRPGLNTIDFVYGRNSVVLEFLDVASPIPPVVPRVPTTPTTPGITPPIVVATINFPSFALTPNQLSAANLLDAVQLDPRAANLISFLNTEPFANLPNDLQKISPDGLTAFYEIGFSNANIQKLNLESRLDDLHNGSNGFSSNMKVNGATVNDKATDGKTSQAVMEPVMQQAPENRWGVWVTGFGDFVNVDGDGNAQGYNFTTGGVSVGLDYRITDQLAIGVFGDYSHTWTSLNPSGHIDVDSGRGGVYATWFSHGIYLNAAIYGGHNTYDSGRAGLGGLANGSTEGSEWSTFIGGGYDFHFGPLTVGPIASLQYTNVGVDSFDEKGSLAPLAIHSDSAESLRSDVGFRAFYQWQIGKLIVEPSLKAAWEHEYKYSALPVTASLAGIPGPSATFFGPSEGHDSAVVSAGVSVQVTPAISTYVNYDGQLGRGNYDSNGVTGGVRISF
jgi:fibronectin-binding autotransporter adhesin